MSVHSTPKSTCRTLRARRSQQGYPHLSPKPLLLMSRILVSPLEGCGMRPSPSPLVSILDPLLVGSFSLGVCRLVLRCILLSALVCDAGRVRR